MAKVVEITISYEDGSIYRLTQYELERLKTLNEAMSLLDRARDLYVNLKPLFEK